MYRTGWARSRGKSGYLQPKPRLGIAFISTRTPTHHHSQGLERQFEAFIKRTSVKHALDALTAIWYFYLYTDRRTTATSRDARESKKLISYNRASLFVHQFQLIDDECSFIHSWSYISVQFRGITEFQIWNLRLKAPHQVTPQSADPYDRSQVLAGGAGRR